MHAAFRNILFRSLLLSKHKPVKKAVGAGDLVLDPPENIYSVGFMETINTIINIIAKVLAPDAIRRLARLIKKATVRIRTAQKPMVT